MMYTVSSKLENTDVFACVTDNVVSLSENLLGFTTIYTAELLVIKDVARKSQQSYENMEIKELLL